MLDNVFNLGAGGRSQAIDVGRKFFARSNVRSLAPSLAVMVTGWAALTAALFALAFLRRDFALDDAYITLSNARALRGGGVDPSFEGSTALTGATSAIHLVILVAAGSVMPLTTASKIVCVAAALLYARALDRIALEASFSRPLLIGVGLTIGFTPYHLVNGLETGLAMAAIAWTLLLRNSRWLPLVAGSLPFVRPELAILGGTLLARQCWQKRQQRIAIVATVSLAALAAMPWVSLNWAMTGSLIPQTAHAKLAFFAENRLAFSRKLEIFILAIWRSWILILLPGLIGLRRADGGWCALLFLGAWLGTAVWEFPGGLDHNYFRYLSEIVPIALFGFTFLASITIYRRPISVILLIFTCISPVYSYPALVDTTLSRARDVMVWTLSTAVPPHSRVMVHDAGYVAWCLPNLRLTDAVGLKSPASIRYYEDRFQSGRDRGPALSAIARASHVNYFAVLTRDPFWGSLSRDLISQGWDLSPINHGSGYTVFRIKSPDHNL